MRDGASRVLDMKHLWDVLHSRDALRATAPRNRSGAKKPSRFSAAASARAVRGTLSMGMKLIES
jgi:hypothetical protein